MIKIVWNQTGIKKTHIKEWHAAAIAHHQTSDLPY
jgi:hypothetical protein